MTVKRSFGAYARIDIAVGDATFWHSAVHALAGLSYHF